MYYRNEIEDYEIDERCGSSTKSNLKLSSKYNKMQYPSDSEKFSCPMMQYSKSMCPMQMCGMHMKGDDPNPDPPYYHRPYYRPYFSPYFNPFWFFL